MASQNDVISCPECQEPIFTGEKEEISDFPINKALLRLVSESPKKEIIWSPAGNSPHDFNGNHLSTVLPLVQVTAQDQDISLEELKENVLDGLASENMRGSGSGEEMRLLRLHNIDFDRDKAETRRRDATSTVASSKFELDEKIYGDSHFNLIQSRIQTERSTERVREQASELCQEHPRKKMEAFCDDCSRPLCIDCILTQDHKSHEMLNIKNGSKNQKDQFEEAMRMAVERKDELEHQIMQIRSHLELIETTASERRETLSAIFNEVRQKILEREQTLKKRISNMLDAERTLFKQKIQNLEEQLKCITEMKLEHQKMRDEPNIKVLLNARLRQELASEATKRLENNDTRTSTLGISALPEISKDDEIACIVKQIVPGSLRPTLLSSTMTSSIRRKQTQEDIRKRELQQQQQQMQQIINVASQTQVLTQLQLGQQQSSSGNTAINDIMKLATRKQRSTSRDSRSGGSILVNTTTGLDPKHKQSKSKGRESFSIETQIIANQKKYQTEKQQFVKVNKSQSQRTKVDQRNKRSSGANQYIHKNVKRQQQAGTAKESQSQEPLIQADINQVKLLEHTDLTDEYSLNTNQITQQLEQRYQAKLYSGETNTTLTMSITESKVQERKESMKAQTKNRSEFLNRSNTRPSSAQQNGQQFNSGGQRPSRTQMFKNLPSHSSLSSHRRLDPRPVHSRPSNQNQFVPARKRFLACKATITLEEENIIVEQIRKASPAADQSHPSLTSSKKQQAQTQRCLEKRLQPQEEMNLNFPNKESKNSSIQQAISESIQKPDIQIDIDIEQHESKQDDKEQVQTRNSQQILQQQIIYDSIQKMDRGKLSKSLLDNVENLQENENDGIRMGSLATEGMKSSLQYNTSRQAGVRKMTKSPGYLSRRDKLNQTNIKNTYRLGNQHLKSFSNSVAKLPTNGLQGFESTQQKQSKYVGKREPLANVSEKSSDANYPQSGKQKDRKGQGTTEEKVHVNQATISEKNKQECSSEGKLSSEALPEELDLSRGSRGSVSSELDPQWQTLQITTAPQNEKKRQPDITDYLTMLSSRQMPTQHSAKDTALIEPATNEKELPNIDQEAESHQQSSKQHKSPDATVSSPMGAFSPITTPEKTGKVLKSKNEQKRVQGKSKLENSEFGEVTKNLSQDLLMIQSHKNLTKPTQEANKLMQVEPSRLTKNYNHNVPNKLPQQLLASFRDNQTQNQQKQRKRHDSSETRHLSQGSANYTDSEEENDNRGQIVIKRGNYQTTSLAPKQLEYEATSKVIKPSQIPMIILKDINMEKVNEKSSVDLGKSSSNESPVLESALSKRKLEQYSCISSGTGGVGFQRKGIETGLKVRQFACSEKSTSKLANRKSAGKESPFASNSVKKVRSSMVEQASSSNQMKVRQVNQAVRRLTMPLPLSSLDNLRNKRKEKSKQLLATISTSISKADANIFPKQNLKQTTQNLTEEQKYPDESSTLQQISKLFKAPATANNTRPSHPMRRDYNNKNPSIDALADTAQRISWKYQTSQVDEEGTISLISECESENKNSNFDTKDQIQLQSQKSDVILQSGYKSEARSAVETEKSVLGYDYSAIFNIKEEYIFVFGGVSRGGSSSSKFLDSVEVFEVSQEIWRIFEDNMDTRRAKFGAVSFFTGGLKKGNGNMSVQQDIIHLVGGRGEDDESLKSVGEFNSKDMKTFQADWKLPVGLSGFGSCQSSSNQVFIAGGSCTISGASAQQKKVYQIFCNRTFENSNSRVQKLGSVAGTDFHYQLRELPDLLEEREDFVLVHDQSSQSSNFSLIAIGGYNSSKGILNSIEKYDSVSGKWTSEEHLLIEGSKGLRAHQAVTLPDGIYILGGFDGDSYFNNLWKFDPSSFAVKSLPPMNVKRAHFSAVVSQNGAFIYAIGGYNSQDGALKSVERFDIVSQRWSILSPMHCARHMHASHLCLINR